jgi:hypothetical protein
MEGDPSSDAWRWPADLDALIAAPDFHTVLFEDDRVRVLAASSQQPSVI